ncbi:hypothetical protein NDU88_003907 [Pleurodeles waltl]|uniref:Uncharacterized protein n=1 Tax=Pleurodeles waltl TaxID=8319 RepID=A0AAV7RHY1_PLEWA|nr:hypothetical protein NDU88_003907 [Pleurodeles waltl]
MWRLCVAQHTRTPHLQAARCSGCAPQGGERSTGARRAGAPVNCEVQANGPLNIFCRGTGGTAFQKQIGKTRCCCSSHDLVTLLPKHTNQPPYVVDLHLSLMSQAIMEV